MQEFHTHDIYDKGYVIYVRLTAKCGNLFASEATIILPEETRVSSTERFTGMTRPPFTPTHLFSVFSIHSLLSFIDSCHTITNQGTKQNKENVRGGVRSVCIPRGEPGVHVQVEAPFMNSSRNLSIPRIPRRTYVRPYRRSSSLLFHTYPLCTKLWCHFCISPNRNRSVLDISSGSRVASSFSPAMSAAVDPSGRNKERSGTGPLYDHVSGVLNKYG